MSTKIAESKRKEIELRAYLLWESEGRPSGCHKDHWARAEAEILATNKKKAPARKPTKAAPKVKSSAKSKKR